MKNSDIAVILRGVANLLELKEENAFRIRAYRKAADKIERLPYPVEDRLKDDRSLRMPGLGKDLAQKIREIIETGGLKFYEELKCGFKEGFISMMEILPLPPGLTKSLYERFKIEDISDLERLTRSHILRILPDIDKEREDEILKRIEDLKRIKRGRIDVN